MSTAAWLCLALPVMAVLLSVYFTTEKKARRLAVKGGTTSVALATAVFCWLRGGGLPSGGIVISAIALFALADVLLDLKFLYGVAAFAAGHIALIFWMLAQEASLQQALFTAPSFSVSAVLYGLSVFIFRKPLSKAGIKAVALLLYAAVLALMTGISLTLFYFGGMRYLLFALGACLFMTSDFMVAQGILAGLARKWRILLMILYESAVLLMALSA